MYQTQTNSDGSISYRDHGIFIRAKITPSQVDAMTNEQALEFLKTVLFPLPSGQRFEILDAYDDPQIVPGKATPRTVEDALHGKIRAYSGLFAYGTETDLDEFLAGLHYE